MLDLVGNPEDRLSHDEAQIMIDGRQYAIENCYYNFDSHLLIVKVIFNGCMSGAKPFTLNLDTVYFVF